MIDLDIDMSDDISIRAQRLIDYFDFVDNRVSNTIRQLVQMIDDEGEVDA